MNTQQLTDDDLVIKTSALLKTTVKELFALVYEDRGVANNRYFGWLRSDSLPQKVREFCEAERNRHKEV